MSIDEQADIAAETCAQCGFDSGEYGRADTLNTLRSLVGLWSHATFGFAPELLEKRPAPEVWSALEYAAHTRDQLEMSGRMVHGVLANDHLALTTPEGLGEHPHDTTGGFEAVTTQLAANAERIRKKADGLEPLEWSKAWTLDGRPLDVGWWLRHSVHDATHHLQDVGRGMHALGAGAPTQHGSVAQLNVSGGGVPKLPVERAQVGVRGLAGDKQASRKHHGRPWQALCLWSTEVIEALAAEGHPIAPGLAGENVTITGVDWSTIRPGTRLRIGTAEAIATAYAIPCSKNAEWFAGGDFDRIHHERHPGSSRIYATVLAGGSVTTGDPVVVEPPA